MKKTVVILIIITIGFVFALMSCVQGNKPQTPPPSIPEEALPIPEPETPAPHPDPEEPEIPDPEAPPESSGFAESLAYLFAGNSTTYLNAVDGTRGAIKTICPDYFDITEGGDLVVTPANKIDRGFISEVKARGLKIVPFISNHWDRTLGNTALENRYVLASQVADLVEEYGLDGVNVDIENVNEQYKEKYTDFVRILNGLLPDEKIVSVAVAANPRGWTLGWHGSYDYKALSDNCDYLMIMSYDESYSGGPEGPISSKSFFDGSVSYALLQGVPKQKIVMGMPFFGRYWKEGQSVGGTSITASDIEFILKNYDSQKTYHEDMESANVTVTIKADDPKPTLWGGRTLGAGTYSIWYDDLRALSYKLELIKTMGLLGAGSWALTQEDKNLWGVYPGAETSRSSYIAASDNGEEDGLISRSEYAKALNKILVLSDAFGINSIEFRDMKLGDDGYFELKKMYHYGLFEAENGMIYPDRMLSYNDIADIQEKIKSKGYVSDPGKPAKERRSGKTVTDPR